MIIYPVNFVLFINVAVYPQTQNQEMFLPNDNNFLERLAIGTRFNDGSNDGSITPFILSWLDNVQTLNPAVIIITVPIEFDKHNSVEMLRGLNIPNLHVIPVIHVKVKAPAGDAGSRRRNSPMLNSMVDKAVECDAKYFMSMSIHHTITKKGVFSLMQNIDDETICVGPVLYVHEGHFKPNFFVEGNGGTCPINTLMIWNLKFLGNVGFPTVIDAAVDRHFSENEELVTIAMLKKLFDRPGHDSPKAKLIRTDGIKRLDEWYNMFPDRENKYTADGKTEQMLWQCKQLNLPIPEIQHLI